MIGDQTQRYSHNAKATYLYADPLIYRSTIFVIILTSNIKKAHGLHRLGSDFQISILLVTFHIWKNLLLFVTYWSTISIINVFYSLYMLLHNWRRFQRRQELVYNNRIFSLVFYTGDGGKRSLQKLDNAGYLV